MPPPPDNLRYEDPVDSPAWPTCRRDDDCIGFRIDRADSCLAHLRAEEQIEFLRGLEPGGGLDLRGTPLTAELVARLVDAMYDGGASRAVLGSVRFEHAKFSGLVRFEGAEFGPAMFVDAEFDGSVDFTGCEFAGPVDFSEVAVRDRARFVEARFDGPSLFGIQANGLEMRGARFAHFVALRVTARTISCDQTRFEEGLSLL
ncbi:MAG TPA: pentapeptide repeat-containing protein, partial [Actinophytocola sp.]|nr:pentapeptide repeat-containing protein [Actinophytocola sp.]